MGGRRRHPSQFRPVREGQKQLQASLIEELRLSLLAEAKLTEGRASGNGVQGAAAKDKHNADPIRVFADSLIQPFDLVGIKCDENQHFELPVMGTADSYGGGGHIQTWYTPGVNKILSGETGYVYPMAPERRYFIKRNESIPSGSMCGPKPGTSGMSLLYSGFIALAEETVAGVDGVWVVVEQSNNMIARVVDGISDGGTVGGVVSLGSGKARLQVRESGSQLTDMPNPCAIASANGPFVDDAFNNGFGGNSSEYDITVFSLCPYIIPDKEPVFVFSVAGIGLCVVPCRKIAQESNGRYAKVTHGWYRIPPADEQAKMCYWVNVEDSDCDGNVISGGTTYTAKIINKCNKHPNLPIGEVVWIEPDDDDITTPDSGICGGTNELGWKVADCPYDDKVGTVKLWSGKSTNIPCGWALMDSIANSRFNGGSGISLDPAVNGTDETYVAYGAPDGSVSGRAVMCLSEKELKHEHGLPFSEARGITEMGCKLETVLNCLGSGIEAGWAWIEDVSEKVEQLANDVRSAIDCLEAAIDPEPNCPLVGDYSALDLPEDDFWGYIGCPIEDTDAGVHANDIRVLTGKFGMSTCITSDPRESTTTTSLDGIPNCESTEGLLGELNICEPGNNEETLCFQSGTINHPNACGHDDNPTPNETTTCGESWGPRSIKPPTVRLYYIERLDNSCNFKCGIHIEMVGVEEVNINEQHGYSVVVQSRDFNTELNVTYQWIIFNDGTNATILGPDDVEFIVVDTGTAAGEFELSVEVTYAGCTQEDVKFVTVNIP